MKGFCPCGQKCSDLNVEITRRRRCLTTMTCWNCALRSQTAGSSRWSGKILASAPSRFVNEVVASLLRWNSCHPRMLSAQFHWSRWVVPSSPNELLNKKLRVVKERGGGGSAVRVTLSLCFLSFSLFSPPGVTGCGFSVTFSLLATLGCKAAKRGLSYEQQTLAGCQRRLNPTIKTETQLPCHLCHFLNLW